jgi:hypothetical protein
MLFLCNFCTAGTSCGAKIFNKVQREFCFKSLVATVGSPAGAAESRAVILLLKTS